MRDEGLKEYLTRIGSIPVMPHETLQDCFKMLECDRTSDREKEKIKAHVIESNLKLVISIAKKYKTSDSLPFFDVIQEGNIGLMKAVDRFDWKTGNRFSTYASWWIRQAISIHISKQCRTVRLPNHAIGVQRRIAKAIQEYNEATGTTPTVDELKLALHDVSDKVLDATLHAGMGTVSINSSKSSSDDDNRTLESVIGDTSETPYEMLANAEVLDSVMKVIDCLSAKEEAVIRLRFGLYDAGLNRDEYLIDKDEDE